jgi:hypothetical protein
MSAQGNALGNTLGCRLTQEALKGRPKWRLLGRPGLSMHSLLTLGDAQG